MDFLLSQEQQELQRSVQRFVEREYQNGRKKGDGHWQKMADLGCLALPFSESMGGLGGSAVDQMLVCEEFGRGLISEPYLPVIFAGQLLEACQDQGFEKPLTKLIAGLVTGLIAGKSKVVTALYEPQSRYDLQAVSSRAANVDTGYCLNGQKSLVLAGSEADYFLVTAKIEHSPEKPLGLFLVDATAKGVSIQGYPTMDGRQAAEVHFDHVLLGADSCIAQGEALLSNLDKAMESLLIGLCAEALGAMEAVLKMTVEYCQQREQFGRSLGKQQAVQHRLVDMFMACEGVRSLLYAAAIQCTESSPNQGAKANSEVGKTVAALKIKTAEAGRYVSEQAVQLHGAIGFTEELLLNDYFKRLMAIAALYGDADFHTRSFIAKDDQQLSVADLS